MPVSNQQINAVYDYFAKKAVEKFNSGEFGPLLAGVALTDDLANPIQGVIGVDPRMLQMLLSSRETKAGIPGLVHLLLDEDSPVRAGFAQEGIPTPDVVVQACEAWVSRGQGDRFPDVAPSEDPHRTEALLVAVHLAGRSEVGVCPIVVGADGQTKSCTYAPLALSDGESNVTGPMSMSKPVASNPAITKH